MKFRVTERFETHSKLRDETLVVLRRDGWDDYGFKTLFNVELIPARGEPIETWICENSQGRSRRRSHSV